MDTSTLKIAVRYYSKGGNTAKLAKAVAEELGVQALPVSAGLQEPVDLLFLGSSVYAAGVDAEVKDFIKNLSVPVGQLVNISTAAILDSTYNQVKKLAAEKNIPVSAKEYHCRGSFAFLHRGRPDGGDVAKVKAFARQVVDGVGG